MKQLKFIQTYIRYFCVCICPILVFTCCSAHAPQNDNKIVTKVKLDRKLMQSNFSSKIKSGNLTVDYTVSQAIKDIEVLRLNTINIPIKVDIATVNSDNMHLDSKSIRKSKKLIKKLRHSGVNIILEPYPWITNGTIYETKFNPKDKNKFFYNWKNNVIAVMIKEIAVPYSTNAVCIASSFEQLEKFENKWLQIYNYTKDKYDGLITYKTNWWYTAQWDSRTKANLQKKLENRIFSKVDFISIAAYFELSEKKINSVYQLKKDLYESSIYHRNQNIVREVEQFNKVFNKPVYFGELGFPTRDYAAKEPWNPEVSSMKNDSEQAKCFEAYREVFTQKWFMGFSVFAIGNKEADKKYYPSNETIRIISKW